MLAARVCPAGAGRGGGGQREPVVVSGAGTMSGPVPRVSLVTVSELTHGQELDHVLLVRARELREGRLRLTLADRTGTLEAAVDAGLSHLCPPGACVRVRGYVEPDRRLAVHTLRSAEPREYDLDD